MSTRDLAVAVAIIFLAACGASTPDKIEQNLGTGSECTVDGSYSDYRPANGCTCKPTWSFNGVTICGGSCGNPDGDPNGPWCFTTSTCNGNNYAYCSR